METTMNANDTQGEIKMTTLRFFGGSCGSDQFFVRCDLSQASAPIQQSGDGVEWGGSQYQCADARHTNDGLASIGKKLAARCFEVRAEEFSCELEEV